MTNEEILKAAIIQAVDNGYTTSWYRNGVWTTGEEYGEIWLQESSPESIIFSHDFAKAFWDNREYCSNCKDIWSESCWCDRYYTSPIMAWKMHLQQLVLEEDPIKYLKKYIN